MNKFLWIVLLALASISGTSQQVLLDDDFSEWSSAGFRYADPTGDGIPFGIDMGAISTSNDETYLYFYFELNSEILLQSSNTLALHIDLDNNPNTGSSLIVPGADLSWFFGNRSGFLWVGSGRPVNHDEVGFISAPTVSSDRFEIAIRRDINVMGSRITAASQIKFCLVDQQNGGDRAPNGSLTSYTYQLSNLQNQWPSVSFQKLRADHLRVLSYNVERDALFDPNKKSSFARIFQTIRPDIIGLQEIYNNTSAASADLIGEFLPSENGVWYHAGVSPDIHIVSKYPVLGTARIDGNGAFLLNVDGTRVLAVVAHLPCCENEASRQREADNLMRFIRDLKDGIGPFALPKDSPIIIMGDMNFVGFREQLQTLLTGRIINTSTFGPSFSPDWDGSAFLDARPLTNESPFTYTWPGRGTSFSPGRLDYIIYSGSVLQLENSYVLAPDLLTNQQITETGLFRSDALNSSDHLPVVADFTFKTRSSTIDLGNIYRISVYPTLAQDLLQINFEETENLGLVRYRIFDASGRLWTEGIIHQSDEFIEINTLPNGPYNLLIQGRNFSQTEKFLIQR